MTELNNRYVLTRLNDDGQRTLAEPMQGRFTYATYGLAKERLDSLKSSMEEKLGFKEIEVRMVECYQGHNDPKTCWFD